ncbi:Ypd1p [Sporobolomyces koalae]|uniref:Ypd1p n=1 Tax=Sporobolomyces koalae TaxID=500713 RepID=UPI003175A481
MPGTEALPASAPPAPLVSPPRSPSKDDAASPSLKPRRDSVAESSAHTTAAHDEPEAKVGVAGVDSDELDDQVDEADIGVPSTDEVVDMEVFGQLLEIDDDETHEFSKTLAFDYISQAETTFHEIEEALTAKDLDALSRKGHFLKGSSAALGLQRVQHSCEAMQHIGKRKSSSGDGPEVSEDEALKRCKALLKRLRKEQEEAKEWLEAFYKEKA